MEFYERVREAASGTPYTVERTADGFDVTLDVVDAEWYGLFNKAGLERVFTHHVKVDDDGSYSITDESRTVEWVAGAPRIGGSVEVFKGRVIEFGAEKIWAFDADGNFGAQADYRFNSEEGRQLITAIGDRLQLDQKRGGAEKVGIFFAVLALGGLLVGGIVVAILALTGVL